jgi:hypothetical protein
MPKNCSYCLFWVTLIFLCIIFLFKSINTRVFFVQEWGHIICAAKTCELNPVKASIPRQFVRACAFKLSHQPKLRHASSKTIASTHRPFSFICLWICFEMATPTQYTQPQANDYGGGESLMPIFAPLTCVNFAIRASNTITEYMNANHE